MGEIAERLMIVLISAVCAAFVAAVVLGIFNAEMDSPDRWTRTLWYAAGSGSATFIATWMNAPNREG